VQTTMTKHSARAILRGIERIEAPIMDSLLPAA
jgi:hypothetical protein